MQKSQNTGAPRVTRSLHADQEVANTGRASTRSAATSNVNTLGNKGKKTLSTLKDSRAGINSATKARSWLIKEELLINGEFASPTALLHALMWLAAGDKNTVEKMVDGIRAVALGLKD